MVIIPSREQQQDAQATVKTAAEVARDARATRRAIPIAVVLSQTKVVAKGRTARHMTQELRSSGLQVLSTEIAEGDACTAMWSLGGTVRDFDPLAVRSIEPAIENAERFAAEILAILEEGRT